MQVMLFYPFRSAIRLMLLVGISLTGMATTVVPPEFPTLVNDSDYIVHARVSAVRSAWRTDRVPRSIVTYVTLEVIEVVAGHPPAAPVLRFLGGQVGNEFERIEGSPQFAVGDEDILFVRGNGRSFCPLYAMGHGRYRISAESSTGGPVVHRASGRPLTHLAEISEPLHGEEADTHGATALAEAANSRSAALTASAFIALIRAEVRPGSRVSQAREE